MNKPWSWKVTQGEKLSEEQPQCESESRLGNTTGCAPTSFHQENGDQQRSDTSCNTLRPNLQNGSNFTAPSLTKKHVFPLCVLAWHETRFHLVETPTPTQFNLLRLRHNTWLNKHEQQLADTLLHLPLPQWQDCTERRTKEDLVTSLCDRGVPDELITDVSSDATHWPTNKPNEPEARIENMTLRHGFWSRQLREQPPCKNLGKPTASTLNLPELLNTKIQTHTNKQFEFYKLRMIRRSWKTTSSRSAETRRNGRQFAQRIAQTQSDELRCNHNTLMGLHWWTRCKAITPRSTCTCQFQVGHRQDISEGWTRNDLVTWLSEKGCWMKSSLTSELKQTIMKKTQSVRNMNKPWSWKVTQGEKLSEEQPQCESESRLETKLAALPHHFTKKTASDNAQTLQARHPGQPCKMIQPSQHPHWRRNTWFLMCPNMTRNTVPLGGHAHSHTIQLTAPPSQHFIEQTRTTTGRRSVALSTLTLKWRRREMSQMWFGHFALRQKVLEEPIVDVSTSPKQSSKQTKKQTRTWPKRLFRDITFGWKTWSTTIWNLIVEPWPLWTNKKTSQRHDTSCNRPPQSRQNESNDPLVLNAKNMFSLRSPCTSTNQQLADTLLHLPLTTLKRLHREKQHRGSRHVTLRQRCARWTHHRRLQWRNTLTNKHTKRIRSTNRKYDIETWLLVKTFARTTSMQEPEHANCFNSQPPRLLNTKIQTHTNKQFEFYKLRMIRRSWKTTSSRSAETRRDKKQLAQHIAQTQSDELRCNHNTPVGLHWWTRRTANTPRNTCT